MFALLVTNNPRRSKMATFTISVILVISPDDDRCRAAGSWQTCHGHSHLYSERSGAFMTRQAVANRYIPMADRLAGLPLSTKVDRAVIIAAFV